MTALPAWVANYIGIPFKARGRTRDGMDCWGLVSTVWNEVFDLGVPSYVEEYEEEAAFEYLAHLIDQHRTPWREVPEPEAHVGDGLLFRILSHPMHVGLVVAPGRFLHTWKNQDHNLGSHLDDWRTPRWGTRLIGVYRHERMA